MCPVRSAVTAARSRSYGELGGLGIGHDAGAYQAGKLGDALCDRHADLEAERGGDFPERDTIITGIFLFPDILYDRVGGVRPDQLHQLLLLELSLIHISEPTRLLSISYAVFC